MQTISAAFLAAKNASHTIIYLAYLSGVNRFYSTYPVTHSGPWLLGQGLVLGGGTLLGAQHSAYGREIARLDEAGLSSVTHAFSPIEFSASISSVVITLRNEADLAAFTDTVTLDNTTVRVLVGFAGLGLADYIPLFTGVIDRYSYDWETLTLDCIDGAFRTHRDLSVLLGSQVFPGTPRDNRGRAIPILLGRNTDVEAIAIEGNTRASLAFDVSGAATTCDLVEFGAVFPDTGTITLGSETGVTYTSRTQAIINEVPYLRLSGLVRAAPVVQAAGLAVILVPLWRYLLGYQIYDLQRVRIGEVVQTSGYTLTQGASGADRPVSLLTFDSPPADTVTVDARGGNLQPLTPLVNGGFETGTGAGWTLNGGTLAVSTGNTDEETYKGEVTGGANLAGGITQDFATLVGQRYTLRFSYRDTETGVNLITNGDFETGLLAPATDRSVAGQALVSITNDLLSLPQGASALLIAPVAGEASYAGAVSWDITTTIGLPYILSMQYTTDYIFTSAGVHFALTTTAGYDIGLPTNPTALASHTFAAQPGGYVQTRTGLRKISYSSGQIAFTATATTTRITVRGRGQVSLPGYPIATVIDNVRLVQAVAVSQSVSSYRLGSDADDDLYASEPLAQRLGYVVERPSFTAETRTTRLSLLSQYTVAGTPTPTYYDNVELLDAGLNPIDAMRYVIETFLPQLPINDTAFTTAHAARSDWRFGTILREPGESRALLQRMAQQCTCRYFEDAQGRATVVAVDIDPSIAVYGLDQTNILEDSISFTREPLDVLATDIYVWYGHRGSTDRSGADSFSAVAYATPEATNHQDSLRLFCGRALTLYGRRKRVDVYADLIQDTSTAMLLLEHLVQVQTLRHSEVTLTTWGGAVHLELGDVVMLTHPRLHGGRPQLCEVQMVMPTPERATVQLRLKETRAAGWVEDFDYPESVALGSGWQETFDVTSTAVAGAGWVEDFDVDELLTARRAVSGPQGRRDRRQGQPVGGQRQGS